MVMGKKSRNIIIPIHFFKREKRLKNEKEEVEEEKRERIRIDLGNGESGGLADIRREIRHTLLDGQHDNRDNDVNPDVGEHTQSQRTNQLVAVGQILWSSSTGEKKKRKNGWQK